MLEYFSWEKAYFRINSIKSSLVNAEDLDISFNKITNFLEYKVLPVINSLCGTRLPGISSPEYQNFFLHLNSSGGVEWKKPTLNFKIPLSKFNNINRDHNLNLLISEGKKFTASLPMLFNGILISKDAESNLPTFKHCTTGHFPDSFFTSAYVKPQSILKHHLKDYAGIVNLPINGIYNAHISNQSLEGKHLVNGAITLDKVDPSIIEKRIHYMKQAGFNYFTDSIENRHFMDKSLGYSHLANGNFSNNGFNELEKCCFNTFAIAPRSIGDNFMSYFKQKDRQLDPVEFIQYYTLTNRHIKQHSIFFGNRGTSKNYNIRKEKLNFQLRRALGIW